MRLVDLRMWFGNGNEDEGRVGDSCGRGGIFGRESDVSRRDDGSSREEVSGTRRDDGSGRAISVIDLSGGGVGLGEDVLGDKTIGDEILGEVDLGEDIVKNEIAGSELPRYVGR